MECLEFEGENSIDRECIRAISMHCANLRTFSLKGDISLGYAPLAEMLAACKKLQHFTLHVSLHENILRAIACNCANFHTLDLSASVMEWSTLVVEMLNTIVIDEGMKLEQLDLPRYLDGLGILPQTVQMWRNSRPLLKITSKNYW